MKLGADKLYFLVKLHRILISRACSNLLDIVAKSIGSNPVQVKTGLVLLEKLKMIRNVRVSGNAFTYELLRTAPMSADVLVEEFGFYLVSGDSESHPDDLKDQKIKALQDEKKNLETRVRQLEHELECLKKYGKSHNKLIEEALIDHGD